MGTLPSGLPELVADDEKLARFLVHGDQLNATLGIAKPSAFLPSPKTNETSVFRHGPEPREELWELGRHAAGQRTIYGAAFLRAEQVRAIHLEVVATEPPPRHAAIRRWPVIEGNPQLQKAKQKELAICLASTACLIMAR